MSLEYIYNQYENKSIDEKKKLLTEHFKLIDTSLIPNLKYINSKNPTGLLCCLTSTDNLVNLLPEYMVKLMTPGLPQFNSTLFNQVFSDRDKKIIRCTRDLYVKVIVEGCKDLWQYNQIVKSIDDTFSIQMSDVFKCFEFGQLKYSDWDFLNCVHPPELILAFFRHLYKAHYKSLLDDESGLPHVAHCYCNILMLLHIIRKQK